ncbi:MAG: GFA family protein [Sandaracinaceae bacterium]
MSESHRGQCYCGAVLVEVQADPVFSAYCHCESCRRWHSAPITALAAWPANAVKITGAVTESTHNAKSVRTTCAACGGGVLMGKPGLGWRVVYPLLLTGSQFNYEPALHLFYGERVMDVNDGLPKFLDAPAEAGGSGTLVDEPERSGWRGR